MKKENIKPGMVVEFRNGKRAFAVKVEVNSNHQEGIIFIGQTDFMNLDSYNENLLVKTISEDIEIVNNWDIMRIYDPCRQYGVGTNGLFSDKWIKEFNLLWSREEVVELSLEDISQKFNIPVSQIRINTSIK